MSRGTQQIRKSRQTQKIQQIQKILMRMVFQTEKTDAHTQLVLKNLKGVRIKMGIRSLT